MGNKQKKVHTMGGTFVFVELPEVSVGFVLMVKSKK
jgi:hypothetical protein